MAINNDEYIEEYAKHCYKLEMTAGLLKSTTGTMLIGLGASTMVYYIVQPELYPEHTVYIGIILVLLGVMVYYFGDVWKIRKQVEFKKTEHKYIEEKAKEIAEEIIDKKMEEISEECKD